MEKYIPTDLLKYVISDYINFDVLVTITNTNYKINKCRILEYNTNNTVHVKIDDIIRKRIIINNENKHIQIQNYRKGKLHGYLNEYDITFKLIERSLYKNNKMISFRKIKK
jgi:hypothetical protein